MADCAARTDRTKADADPAWQSEPFEAMMQLAEIDFAAIQDGAAWKDICDLCASSCLRARSALMLILGVRRRLRTVYPVTGRGYLQSLEQNWQLPHSQRSLSSG